jgi:hypothetical protein
MAVQATKLICHGDDGKWRILSDEMGSTNGIDRNGRGKGLLTGVSSTMMATIQYWMKGKRDRE